MAKIAFKHLKRKRDMLAARLEPEFQVAFAKSMQNVKSGTDMAKLVSALQKQDVDAAVDALDFSIAAMSPMLQVLENSFEASGTLTSMAINNVRK